MKKVGIIGLVVILLALIAYNYIYKDHRNIKTETSAYTVTAAQLANEFKVNATKAEGMYLNKTIEVSGTISSLKPTEITIEEKVFCLFNDISNSTKQQQETVTIKGRFIGYDDLLEEIKLDQCSIIN